MLLRESRTARIGLTATAIAALANAALLTGWLATPGPRAAAEPAGPTSTPQSSDFPSDEYGFLDSAARCDEGQTLMAFGRTARALVAVCVGPDGQLEYRGVRLSDGAEITMGAGRSADGAILATNDDVTYSISPDAFLVSEGDAVLYRDTWVEFHEPRSPGTSTTSSTTSSTTPSSTATSTTKTPPTTTPTVSTTTVTPSSDSGDG